MIDWERIEALTDFIAIEHGANEMHRWKVAKIEEVLELDEIEKLFEARAKVDKSKVIAKVKLRAIKEFKASKDFEAEVPKGSSIGYEYGFKTCKVQVTQLLLGVDLSHLQLEDSDDEAEEDPSCYLP